MNIDHRNQRQYERQNSGPNQRSHDQGIPGDNSGRGRGHRGGGRGRGLDRDRHGSRESLDETYPGRQRQWNRDERNARQGDIGRGAMASQRGKGRDQFQHGGRDDRDRDSHRRGDNYRGHDKHDYSHQRPDSYRAHDTHSGHRDEQRDSHRKDHRAHEQQKGQSFQALRDNRGATESKRIKDYEEKYGDYEGDSKETQPSQPHRGGLIHLPSQQPSEPGKTHEQDGYSRNSCPPPSDKSEGPSGREHTQHTHSGHHAPPAHNIHSRERNNSGPGRQKTLYDPNNPSKPIVIDDGGRGRPEDGRGRLEFRDTDSNPASPQYAAGTPPMYPGGTPPRPDFHPHGYGPFFPPGRLYLLYINRTLTVTHYIQ